MKLLVIGVCYRTRGDAVRFCHSILSRCKSRDVHVTIVDNSERAQDMIRVEDLPQGDERIDLVRAPTNLGYLGGAEIGLSTYLSRHEWPDWIAVSNVDLTVEEPTQLLMRLDNPSGARIGVVAPRIVREDTGHDLNPFMRSRPSRLRMWLYAFAFHWYAGLTLYDWLAMAKRRTRRIAGNGGGRHTRPRSVAVDDIYAAHGSFFVLSAEFFRRGGSLRYEPFLFGEELHIAEQARNMSLRVVHDPAVVITHRANASMRLLRGKLIHGFVRQSSWYIARTYFRRSHRTAAGQQSSQVAAREGDR